MQVIVGMLKYILTSFFFAALYDDICLPRSVKFRPKRFLRVVVETVEYYCLPYICTPYDGAAQRVTFLFISFFLQSIAHARSSAALYAELRNTQHLYEATFLRAPPLLLR